MSPTAVDERGTPVADYRCGIVVEFEIGVKTSFKRGVKYFSNCWLKSDKTSAGEIKKGTGKAVLPGSLVNVHDERE